MEDKEAPAPYDAIEPYMKMCRNCNRLVFLDVDTCPSCDGTEFNTVDMTIGD